MSKESRRSIANDKHSLVPVGRLELVECQDRTMNTSYHIAWIRLTSVMVNEMKRAEKNRNDSSIFKEHGKVELVKTK